jgi:hypothetical protein
MGDEFRTWGRNCKAADGRRVNSKENDKHVIREERTPGVRLENVLDSRNTARLYGSTGIFIGRWAKKASRTG